MIQSHSRFGPQSSRGITTVIGAVDEAALLLAGVDDSDEVVSAVELAAVLLAEVVARLLEDADDDTVTSAVTSKRAMPTVPDS